MRKLATVETIKSIKPHLNADSLELATVRGWQVVVKKGEFQEGQECVYCEIDSVLPPRPEFAFLEPRGYRVKTIKMRGELSQGIIFPTSVLPEGGTVNVSSWIPGDDVTEVIGVKLYEPSVSKHLGGDALGPFPYFIPKTDEERAQNMFKMIKENAHRLWVGTEKLDGSSMTVHYLNGNFGVSSRNLQLKETDNNAYWAMVRRGELKEKLTAYCKKNNANIAIQGELIGPKVQGNPYGLSNYDYRIFNVFDIDKQDYYNFDSMMGFIDETNLLPCPILHVNQPLDWLTDVNSLLAKSDGNSLVSRNKVAREGIVWRTMDSPRISFKAISNKFLLKSQD